MNKMDVISKLISGSTSKYSNEIKAYVHKKIREILGDALAQTEEGMSYIRNSQFRWLLDIKDGISFGGVPLVENDIVIGVQLQNGVEVGLDFYFDRNLRYRVPAGYLVSPAGVWKNPKIIKKSGGECISIQPLIPISLLTIGGGRFPSYVKFRNSITKNTFIECLSKLTFLPRNKLLGFTEFINLCIRFNSIHPILINMQEFN